MNTLLNGAFEIHRKNDVVLAKSGDEFVTWRVGPDGNTYLGNYFFNNFAAAVEDFNKRCAE